MSIKDHPVDIEAFGAVVRELRTAKGLSQEGLGRVAELHRTYLGSCERGESSIGLRSLLRIAAALETRPSELLRRYEEVVGWPTT